MSDSDRSQIPPFSEAGRAEIADLWYRAVRRTGFSPHPAATVRAQLRALTDRAIAIVVGEHSAWEAAEDVGAAMVRLGYDATGARQSSPHAGRRMTTLSWGATVLVYDV